MPTLFYTTNYYLTRRIASDKIDIYYMDLKIS
jgi:hypothetical protein